MNRSKLTLAVCMAALIAVACSSGPETQTAGNSNASGAAASAGSSNSNTPAPSPVAAAPAPPPANANTPAADAKPSAPDQKKDDAKNAAAKPAAAAAADGAALWAANKCSFCHAADGKGNPKMKGVPDFTDAAWQKKEGDGELASVIKNGKKPMPPFGKTLSDNEIKALVAFVRGFAKK
jgi:mono/diheme cytochrome c family protein